MKKNQSTGMWILGFLLLIVLFASSILTDSNGVTETEIPFSQFLTGISEKQYSHVDIVGNVAYADPVASQETKTPGAETTPAAGAVTQPAPGAAAPAEPSSPATTITLADKTEKTDGVRPSGLPQHRTRFKVMLPDNAIDNLLVPRLEEAGIDFAFKQPQASGHWLGILSTVFLPLIIIVFFIMLLRNAQAGGSQALSFGKSKAKLQMDSNVKITFGDVAGIDESKAELEEVVDFLKNSERYQKLGAKIPKGVLLVGSPGTGKTLLAKAVAGEAGVPFFTISGSDFVEMFVGVGASRVRDLFEQAKKHAPCIIFVDEIDAVGRQRGAGMGGGHDEREQTLNQLLVEMDGFDPHTGIIVIAATNRPDILDNALLRPGRFDRQVMIDRPDVKGREDILKVHAKGKPLAPDVDLKLLAKRTPGFTGADLSNLLNEGALTAARKDQDVINQIDIENSIEKVMAGPEKRSRIIKEKDKEITAYHEVGHALIGMLTPHCDPVRKVSIIPRGMALGLTWTMPEDQVHVTKNQLMAQIGMLLGGRVAEEIVFGDVTTGASNDLERVSAVARKIVTVYGMNEKLGPITYGKRNEHVFMGRDFGTERDYGDEVAIEIDREVKQLVDAQYEYARKLINDNRDMLEAVTKVLLEKETIDDDEVRAIMDDVREERGEPRQFGPRGELPETAEEAAAKAGANGKAAPTKGDACLPPVTGDEKTPEESVN
ncbi:MAG: ATP-dependent zinc metalloprotease FtsH [Candidatus Melainabacteria bacterium]